MVVKASMVPSIPSNKGFQGFLYAMFTFMLVNVTWVFFRSNSFGRAGEMLNSMFGGVGKADPLLSTLAMIKIAVIITGMLIFHWFMRDRRVTELIYRLPWWLTGLVWSAIVILLILSQETSNSFIYFQF
jgi:hypothetical protein